MTGIYRAMAYGILFLCGLISGGFVNVCADRLPKRESLRKKASCGSCREELRRKDQIPLVSYLLLKGRCRSCGARISVRYPLTELVNGVLYITVFMANGFNLMSGLYCLMTSAFLVISIVDEQTLEIPLPCNLFLGTVGILACILDFTNLLEHLLGAAVIFLLLYALYFFSKGAAIGGGDVKLMAAAGLILGWKKILIAFLLACIIGSVCHLIRMKVSKAGSVLAMGPYLCIGAWICALWGDEFIQWYLSFLIV